MIENDDDDCPSAAAAPGPAAWPDRARCPSCDRLGKPLDTITVKALLAGPLTAVREVAYRFCSTLECPTVYYSADSLQTFTADALRERVHQKHPDAADVPVCYCFRHTLGTIREEVRVAGQSTAVQRVTAGIQAGQCACEIRNPQGSCCLGNVRAAVRRIEGEVAVDTRMGPAAPTPLTTGPTR